jgi:hypothetical protein
LRASSNRVSIFLMWIESGSVREIFGDGCARIQCATRLIPKPGQYLSAHAAATDSLLPVPLFFSAPAPLGFRCAPPLPAEWRPGTSLVLRGPLGRGFSLPASTRKVALIAFDDSAARLRGLIHAALGQNAEVTLLCDSPPDDLPEAVEVQPLKAASEVIPWAEYAAVDVERGNLDRLKEMLGKRDQASAGREAQVLVRAPMPCGALAECGVCALPHRHGWRMICRDGPVFELGEVL